MLGDPAAVSPDLGTLGVLLGGDVTEFLEQRHVDIGLDVAGDFGIAVPVPGSADVGGLIDQPHVVHTELLAPGPDQQPAEAGAHHGDVDGVVNRVSAEVRVGPGVLAELAESTGDRDILRNPVGTEPALAFLGILGA